MALRNRCPSLHVLPGGNLKGGDTVKGILAWLIGIPIPIIIILYLVDVF
jgi:hypothetical protein